MRNKLLIIVGALIFTAGFTLAVLGVRTARKAVTEKVVLHLKDKAADTAEIINGRVTAFFQFLEGIARMPILTDENLSYSEKAAILDKEVVLLMKDWSNLICMIFQEYVLQMTISLYR